MNNGGPAFPTGTAFQGMTLRDYFAAQAMQALIEKTELLIRATLEDGTHHGAPEDLMAKHKAAICESAYTYADAMLEAKEK